MNQEGNVQRLYGDPRVRIRLLLRIEDADGRLTNRDLISVATAADWATRTLVDLTLSRLGPALPFEPAERNRLLTALDELPAAAIDVAELVEFRRGSWQIALDLPDTGIVLLLLWILEKTLGQDLEKVWSKSRGSNRFRHFLATDVPAAMGAAAQGLARKLTRSGKFGKRHVVERAEVRESQGGPEIQVIVSPRRAAVVGPRNDMEE